MIKRIYFSFLLVLISSFLTAQNYYEERDSIPDKYKWDMTLLFDDWRHWEKVYQKTETGVNAYAVEDTFNTASGMYEELYTIDTLSNRISKLSLYVKMLLDVNREDEFASKQQHKLMLLNNKFYLKTGWLYPYIQKIKPDTFYKWLNNYPKLKNYEYYYRNILRDSAHIISQKMEATISNFDYGIYGFFDAYNAIMLHDNKQAEININDSLVPLTSVAYANIMLNEENREIRKKAYLQARKKYNSNKNTIAALLSGALSMQYAYAQAYNFDSSIESVLDSDSIPVELYTNLIGIIKQNTAPLQKYHKLRAKALGISDYSPYDTGIRIALPKVKYDIEFAKELISKSVEPLGSIYKSKTDKCLNNRTIDYFENKNKLTGVAYCTHYYGSPPFILTSYGGSLKDIYDLIHELGHGVHADYSMENQSISTYESSIFIDEITSTFNELLLTDYLLNNWQGNESKLYLLETAINNIEYYYKSALHADFVYQLYDKVENRTEITASELDQLYAYIYSDFYGESISLIDSSSWCAYGIVDFYDYQYVTSMTASLKFFEEFKSNRKSDVLENYMSLLKAGGNDYPLNQLEKAGVDLMNAETYSAISEYMSLLVDEYEKELNRKGLLKRVSSEAMLTKNKHKLSGKVVNNEGVILPYVNIGIPGKGIGTVSNETGNFTLEISKENINDSIKFSLLGCKSEIYAVRDLLKKNTIKISLQEKAYEIEEVTITAKEYKYKTFGNAFYKPNRQCGFAIDKLGNEVAVVMKNRKEAYIQSVTVGIAVCTYDTLFLRLNVYEYKKGEIGESILKKPYYINLSKEEIKEKAGIMKFDLSNLNLSVSGKFAVGIETVKDYSDIEIDYNELEGFYFYDGIYRTTKCLDRFTSHAKWERSPFNVSITATVLYK